MYKTLSRIKIKTFILYVPLLLAMGALFTFFREVAVAYYFGTSRELEIFRIGFAIPYALFQSLGSTIVAGLLPILIEYGNTVIPIIKREIQKIFFIFCILSVLSIKWQAKMLAPGFNLDDLNLLEINILISWFMLFPLALILPIRLSLQGRDKKILVSATSLIYSGSFIFILPLIYKTNLDFKLPIVSLISTLIVLIIYNILKEDYTTVQENISAKVLQKKREIQKIIIGSIIYVFVLALPNLIDKAAASKMIDGTIANIDYAMNFYIALGVLIGTSAIIIFTKKIASEYNKSMNVTWLLKVAGMPTLFALIVSLCLIPFTDEIVSIAYLRGAFSELDVMHVSEILYWFLIALPIMIAGMILMQVLASFSIGSIITISIVKAIVKLSWILIFFTQNNLSIFGISTLVMELVSIIIILYLLHYFSSK